MNNQMLVQIAAYNKVRAVKALAAAETLAADLTEVAAVVTTATETLASVQEDIVELREDVDGLML